MKEKLMPPETYAVEFPRDEQKLADLHFDIASAFAHRLANLGDALALIFGYDAAHASLRVLVVETNSPAHLIGERRTHFDQIGWRAFLDDEMYNTIDAVDLTVMWREAVEYAGQGLAPREPPSHCTTLEERATRIKELIAYGRVARCCAASLLGHDYDYIWDAVAARAAIDFGGSVSIRGLQLLSELPLPVVRNAISNGDLRPNEEENVTAEEARAWLARRREFCPSRWKNPADNQWALDLDHVVMPKGRDVVLVPQSAEGDAFVPDLVMRPVRGERGGSVTIGAKGKEVRHNDFYEALMELAKMDVARWRRRNDAGNWGIVRARGAWVAVDKAEIDRQLTEKLGGAH